MLGKKKKIVKVSLITVLIIVIGWISLVYIFEGSSAFIYNEKWIIGKTREEIQERYGEFDCKTDYNSNRAHYIIAESIADKYLDGPPRDRYYILFNEDGLAEKAYKSVAPGG